MHNPSDRGRGDGDGRSSGRHGASGKRGRPTEHRGRSDRDRGGADRHQRPGQFRRKERLEEPVVPEAISGRELDRDTRDQLRILSKETAERVARHLVAAGHFLDDDPALALRHAQFAARVGGRVGIVREAYGIVAYRVGKYRTAIQELRTSMRITGQYDVLPLVADAERGLGRPERALDIASSPEAEGLELPATIELMIVIAGAYADTGDIETALATLDIPALRQKVDGTWQVRLWVAYADLLEKAGRTDEARKWITLAADADTDRLTDAAERLGRPAPVHVAPSWEDDERISVTDAQLTDEEIAEELAAAEDTQQSEDTEQSVNTEQSEDLQKPEDTERPEEGKAPEDSLETTSTSRDGQHA